MRLSLSTACGLLTAVTIPAAAQTRPAPRPLGAVVATTPAPFGSVSSIRGLSGGRVLVNDPTRRQVLMLDSSLAIQAVVADTTPATGNAYSGRFAGLLAYRGDSTLFVDPQSLSMLMIHPDGRLGRTMSIPNTQEAAFLAGAQGNPGVDPQGRIIYRGGGFRFLGGLNPRGGPPGAGAGAGAGGGRGAGGADGAAALQNFMPTLPESIPVQRIDIRTRKIDTVAFFRVPRPSMTMTQTEGRVMMSSKINPIPLVDEWAALPNGDVAVVRGRDYHVDFVRADGRTESAAKVPFNWRRLTDDEKVAFLDSVKAARARMPAPTPGAAGPAMAFGSAGGGSAGGPPVPPPGGGGQVQVMIMTGGPGSEPPMGGGPAISGGAGGGGRSPIIAPQVTFVEPSELPDYLPPFAAGAVRADPLGRIWVRLSLPTPAGTGPLYDILDGNGALIDHVQLPAGRLLAGFGADGSVYLSKREEGGFTALERAQFK